MSTRAYGQLFGDRRRQWPLRCCHLGQFNRRVHVKRPQLNSTSSRWDPAGRTVVACHKKEPWLLLSPVEQWRSAHLRSPHPQDTNPRQRASRGDWDHPLKQVCDKLRYPFGTMLLLQLGHFRAGGDGHVEHDTEQRNPWAQLGSGGGHAILEAVGDCVRIHGCCWCRAPGAADVALVCRAIRRPCAHNRSATPSPRRPGRQPHQPAWSCRFLAHRSLR